MSDFENAKVGDDVCVLIRSAFYGPVIGIKVGKIEKVTKTQVTALGERWNKRWGDRRGSGSFSTEEPLRYLTPELEAEAAKGAAEHDAQNLLYTVAGALRAARGEEAVRLAALLPDELRSLK